MWEDQSFAVQSKALGIFGKGRRLWWLGDTLVNEYYVQRIGIKSFTVLFSGALCFWYVLIHLALTIHKSQKES